MGFRGGKRWIPDRGQESLNSLYRIVAGDQMVMEKLKEN